MKKIRDVYENPSLTTRYTSKWEQYFDVYDTYLQKFIGKNPVVLEIGIDNGGFLETLHHYLENATIYGVDIRPKVLDVGLDNVKIFQGDQGDDKFWDDFISKVPHFDIVIDDGSHFMHHQIQTFEKLFPKMSPKGIYLVEDTHTSYMIEYCEFPGGKDTFIEYTKSIIDWLHIDHFEEYENKNPVLREMNSIHFYDSIVAIERAELVGRPKYTPTYVHREEYIR